MVCENTVTSLTEIAFNCWNIYKLDQAGMVVHMFNPSTQWQRQMDLCKFKSSQVYIASSRLSQGYVVNRCLKINKYKQNCIL